MIYWGILGPGRIARQFAGAFSAVESGKVVSVHSSDLNRAQAFAKQYQIPHATSALDEFLAMQTMDVIYIAYPHSMHFEAIKRCLNAGKHVLCEKPLTVSRAQAEEIFELAKEKQLFLMEALWTRFLPAWIEVKHLLESNIIGELQQLTSSFGFAATFDPLDRLFNPDLAGGATWDIGIYPIAMTHHILGSQPVDISVDVLRGTTGVDEHVVCELEYTAGVKSRFIVSLRERLENSFHIQGSRGSIHVEEPFWGAEKFSLSLEGEATQYFDYAHDCNGFEYQIRAANECINHSKLECELMTWQASIDCQEVIDTILAV